MFTACLAFLRKPPARLARTGPRSRLVAARPCAPSRPSGPVQAATILGALNFLLAGGCALEERPGDGLVTDGNQVVVSPMVPYDRPPPMVDMNWPPCKAQEVFAQKVAPHFVKRCVECHDGTNGNAIIKMASVGLTGPSPDATISCQSALFQGASEADKNQAGLLVFVDPARPDKDHEFKYEDVAEFNAYKADILTWLNAEKP